MLCEVCGQQATRRIVDKIEINGGHIEGQEHLPPMIHHQHKTAHVCDEHAREPKVHPNEDLRKVREGWTGKYPTPAPAPATV